MPLVTIITVVFNDREGLERTIRSVEEQTNLADVEYLVIDGKSTDNTVELIEQCHIINKYISEKDHGIYDAMNKGIRIASGDWILFLNAGDSFHDKDVLSSIKKEISSVVASDVNLIYSDYISGGFFYEQSLSINFLTSHMINHQNIFYNKSLFADEMYSTKYRFCADYNHLLHNIQKIKAHKIDFVISIFDDTGISSQPSNKYKMWVERLDSVWSSELPFFIKLRLSKRGIIALPYQFIRATLIKMSFL